MSLCTRENSTIQSRVICSYFGGGGGDLLMMFSSMIQEGRC